MWYENVAVNLADLSFSFITFVLDLLEEFIKDCLPEFFGLLLRIFGNSQFIFL